MRVSEPCLSSLETSAPSLDHSSATAEPLVAVVAAETTGPAAVVVGVAPALSVATQFGPASAPFLLTINPGPPNEPGPVWPPVAPGGVAAALAVVGMGVAVVGMNPAVAAVKAKNGHST